MAAILARILGKIALGTLAKTAAKGLAVGALSSVGRTVGNEILKGKGKGRKRSIKVASKPLNRVNNKHIRSKHMKVKKVKRRRRKRN